MIFDAKDAFGGWKLLNRELCPGVNQLVTDMDISQGESECMQAPKHWREKRDPYYKRRNSWITSYHSQVLR
ncbi:hypothetical protein FGO68_gene8624 [Halteria grandinella]|uniref:Uncharacterized protein n=1 Tax=Halteria grandinella TaxID=5974 RepID=A0A8J8ND50_HALGN|nr:hypothetical protein FGO68_gene8624 [Halteria grandinella]